MSGEIELEEVGLSKLTDIDPLLKNQQIANDEDDVAYGRSITICRICLECDGHEDNDLISPCLCKGTEEFVHRACLDHWRSVKFHLQVVELRDNSWREIKFRLFVGRDVFLVFLILQTVIGMIGGLAYIADKDGTFRTFFTNNW